MFVGNKDLYEREQYFICPSYSFSENGKDSGCYYLSPKICKDIIITAGVSGIHTPKAIFKMRKNIDHVGDIMEDEIPAFRCMDREIISYYAGELAECLVKAARVGKGVEIAFGYPKVLVFKVN